MRGRLIGWYRALVFSSGSIIATTGFTIYGLIANDTKDLLRDSITYTLLNAKTSFLVDRNTIKIIQQFFGKSSSLSLSTELNSSLLKHGSRMAKRDTGK